VNPTTELERGTAGDGGVSERGRRDVETDVQVWTRTLNELAQHLNDASAALDRGDIDGIEPFPVPAGLPALPESCARQARSLLNDQQSLEASLRRALAERESIPAHHTQHRSVPRHARFDARG